MTQFWCEYDFFLANKIHNAPVEWNASECIVYKEFYSPLMLKAIAAASFK